MVSRLKVSIAFTAWLFCIASVTAQSGNCHISVSGTVICNDDGEPVIAASVGLAGTEKNAYTNDQGKFTLGNVCPGAYRLKISLIGYKSLDTLIQVSANLNLNLKLRSDDIHLAEVHIGAQKIQRQEVETIAKVELSGIQLQQTRGGNLGDALKDITGVNAIQSGPTISKPVIHGLHSNRILILNNGVRQEGQQWGSEHAPEIDPFVATKLSVVKGAASIRYGADAIGGVVLVEPAEMPKGKSLGGEINLVGIDNGRLYVASGILEGALDKKLSGLSYRLQGTYRRAGNLKAPNYYLDNTGLMEKNYSAELEYSRSNYGANVYYSQFNTDIGIYTGSHVGNPDELLQVFNGEKKIEDYGFSYHIKRGYQKVNHDLLKVSAFLSPKGFGKLTATFAQQTDIRQEFDVHVPYTSNGVDLSNAPQVFFQLITQTTELVWEHPAWHHLVGSIGTNFITQGNVFKGLTYRSLIPNFRNYGGGLFAIEKWNRNRLTLEAGLRYDYKWQRVYMSNPNSLELETPTQRFSNVTGTLGATYRFTPNCSLNFNAGNAWRAPSIYELFAYGIHGASSTFEVGDSTLRSERAYNFCGSLRYQNEALQAELGVYSNFIYNYIYLQPQPGQHAVTYQGAYPLFRFVQTDALFKGIDLDIKWHITKQLQLEPKATLLLANNLQTKGYLVLIPPQRLQCDLMYKFEQLGGFKDLFFQIGGLFVAKQNRVPPNSDFVPPPNAYALLSAGIGSSFNIGRQHLNVSVQGTNLLNSVYRDYLNLFRYYADAPGRSIQLRVQMPFQIISNTSNSNTPVN